MDDHQENFRYLRKTLELWVQSGDRDGIKNTLDRIQEEITTLEHTITEARQKFEEGQNLATVVEAGRCVAEAQQRILQLELDSGEAWRNFQKVEKAYQQMKQRAEHAEKKNGVLSKYAKMADTRVQKAEQRAAKAEEGTEQTMSLAAALSETTLDQQHIITGLENDCKKAAERAERLEKEVKRLQHEAEEAWRHAKAAQKSGEKAEEGQFACKKLLENAKKELEAVRMQETKAAEKAKEAEKRAMDAEQRTLAAEKHALNLEKRAAGAQKCPQRTGRAPKRQKRA